MELDEIQFSVFILRSGNRKSHYIPYKINKKKIEDPEYRLCRKISRNGVLLALPKHITLFGVKN